MANFVTVKPAEFALELGVEQRIHEAFYGGGVLLGFSFLTGEPIDENLELRFLDTHDSA